MGLSGKFISNAWNGIKEKIGTAGKMIKDNQNTIGKIAGTALGTTLLIGTNGTAAPYIAGANDYIQSLPDNEWTKHLKNIAKGAMFDYGQQNTSKTKRKRNTSKTNAEQNTSQTNTEKDASQTNAQTEYQAPKMSSFILPSTGVSSPNTVYRDNFRNNVNKFYAKQTLNKFFKKVKSKRQKAKGKKTKGKKTNA